MNKVTSKWRKHGATTYITFPPKFICDSAFPFKAGEEMRVDFTQQGKIILMKKEGGD